MSGSVNRDVKKSCHRQCDGNMSPPHPVLSKTIPLIMNWHYLFGKKISSQYCPYLKFLQPPLPWDLFWDSPHTKRIMGRHGCHPSFGMTTTKAFRDLLTWRCPHVFKHCCRYHLKICRGLSQYVYFTICSHLMNSSQPTACFTKGMHN